MWVAFLGSGSRVESSIILLNRSTTWKKFSEILLHVPDQDKLQSLKDKLQTKGTYGTVLQEERARSRGGVETASASVQRRLQLRPRCPGTDSATPLLFVQQRLGLW